MKTIYSQLDELIFIKKDIERAVSILLNLLKIKSNMDNPVLLHQLLVALKNKGSESQIELLLEPVVKMVALKGYLPLAIAILKEFKEYSDEIYNKGIELLSTLYCKENKNICPSRLTMPPPPLPPVIRNEMKIL